MLVSKWRFVGTDRPYYIGKKGLRPEGVYVRRGIAKIPLSHEGIRKMISDSYGESFERRRSMNQDLTFKSFYEEMDARNIDVSSAENSRLCTWSVMMTCIQILDFSCQTSVQTL